MEEVTRKSGLSAGKSDVYYFRYLNHRAACVHGVHDNDDDDGDVRDGK